MIATSKKAVRTIMLMVALTVSGVCLANLPDRDAANEDAIKFADPTATMFPDGVKYDFGRVQRGSIVEHTFRIVNTSNVPLRIIALRRS
jgi:hypothetical protein